ncbi:alpha/beta hydrolase [Paeniglutamicibacter antarcticus]|uniref:Alpha/beta hydrolase n=1 Tax=Arthrobacter terrae TaxID=2935737 RepID=A0A931CTV6_9MICC|nr:alpha/beta hydrolase [Arthrobacter terrae]MBG0739733.1 alpha/beta hydrolase [Arthrobacter terrae]
MAKNDATANPEPGQPRGAQPNQQAGIGRRSVLLSLTGAAAVTAFRANIAANYLITDNLSFQVVTLENAANNDAASQFPGATWYLLGGFEVSNGTARRKLEALQPAMNERAQASYIGYSNRGIDVAQLFIAIIRDAYVRKINTVYLYGDSFGGMVAVALAPLLEQNGLHVKLIVFGSSPSSVADVKDPGKQYISLAGAVVPYLGIVGRLTWGVWSGLRNPNGQDMYAAAKSGVQTSFDGEQNSLILNTSQATFLKAFPAQYDGGIAASTGIGLLYDPQDFIVDAASAIRGWHRLLPANNFFRYDIANTGHASPEIHPETYQTALRVLQDVLAPLPSVPRGRTRYF